MLTKSESCVADRLRDFSDIYKTRLRQITFWYASNTILSDDFKNLLPDKVTQRVKCACSHIESNMETKRMVSR